jgi:EAL domain-containing protein (putative c-di-GMP-specific phosphodiesterase class I)
MELTLTHVCRISGNVSVPELKDEHFCDDINRIIDASGVPGDKIAIESHIEERTERRS